MHDAQERPDVPLLRDMDVDGEIRHLRQEQREDGGVQKRDVVGDDHGPLPGRHIMLGPAHLDAVKQAEDGAEQKAEKFFHGRR